MNAPRFFPISTVARGAHGNEQPQVDAAACVATHERGIFCLGIHAHKSGTRVEALRDECRAMREAFDRLEEGEFMKH